jgi:DNA-binding MarR family transcriptional regulator
MGLVSTASMNSGDRSLVCRITAKGNKLVEKVIPGARERHARLLLSLNTEDRVKLYEILQKLQVICADID